MAIIVDRQLVDDRTVRILVAVDVPVDDLKAKGKQDQLKAIGQVLKKGLKA